MCISGAHAAISAQRAGAQYMLTVLVLFYSPGKMDPHPLTMQPGCPMSLLSFPEMSISSPSTWEPQRGKPTGSSLSARFRLGSGAGYTLVWLALALIPAIRGTKPWLETTTAQASEPGNWRADTYATALSHYTPNDYERPIGNTIDVCIPRLAIHHRRPFGG